MIKAQNGGEINLEKAREAVAQTVAAMIRQSSEAGQLIAESEILRRLAEQHHLSSPALDGAEKAGRRLREVLAGREDCYELVAQDGTRYYYASPFLTEAYATILIRKQGDPLRLIAETVRENSAVYPRPVPMDIFTQPPFAFAREEVQNYLEQMAAEEEYRDILPTTTSASRIFLYSTIHLEADYASMLAEWIDVGQLENP
jgi:hypothetical protein